MNLDSKALPLVAGLVVLGAAVLLIVGKDFFEPATATPQTPTGVSQVEPAALHPTQVEARLAIREGRMDDARDALASVPESDPLYVNVLLDLAVIYESRGQPTAALATGAKLLNLDPENSEGHHVMARAFYAETDYPQAERQALRAIEIAPNNISARFTIGLIRLASGHVDRSIDAYLRAMRLSRDQASIDAALTDLALLENARPDLAEVHYVMAFFAGTLGSTDQEILELERFLADRAEGPVADQARQQLAELKSGI